MADALSYIGLKKEKRNVEKQRDDAHDQAIEKAAKEIENTAPASASKIRLLKKELSKELKEGQGKDLGRG